MHKIARILAGGALTSIAVTLAGPAWAQAAGTAESGGSGGSGDIIVTARRVEERLQDVPISMTVFNQDQLTKNNVVNAADLAINTPSLSANSNFGSENTSFAIRGFVQENGTSPAVGVYFADVVAPRAASNGIPAGDGAGPGSFFDLQNVQVLKGPQGTLFGRNTTGGAVLLVPQKPTDKLEGYARGTIGNYGLRHGEAVINLPLSDTFRVRLGVDRMKRDGYIHNTSGIGPKDFNDVNYWAARLSIVGDLTPNLENYVVASFSRSDTHGDMHKLIAGDPTFSLGSFAAEQLTPGSTSYQGAGFYDASQGVPNARTLLRTWQVIDTTTWRASDNITVKNIISYAELKEKFDNPIFGANFKSPAIPAIAALGFPGLPEYNFNFANSLTYPGRPTANESTFTEEFRIQGNTPNSRLSWQVGAYLESARPLELVGSKSSVLLNCPNDAARQASQCYDILGYLGGVGGFLGTLGAGGTFPAAIAAYNSGLSNAGTINVTTGQTSFHNVGLYGQATYKLSDAFKVTGGLRYTWDKENNDSTQYATIEGYPLAPTAGTFLPFVPIAGAPQYSYCTYADASNATTGGVQNHFAGGTVPDGSCQRNLHSTSHAPTWLIDFDYTPNQNILVYAKYARGYRTGGVNPNAPTSLAFFSKEKVDAFEVGSKTSFRGAVPGTFNVAAFYNKLGNQQLQLGLNPNSCFSLDAGGNCVRASVSPTAVDINAGKSKIYGVEVNASVRPFRGLDLSVAYTYTRSRIDAITLPTGIGGLGAPFELAPGYHVGDPLLLTPRNKVNLTGSYTLPLDEKIGAITLGATFTHTDKQITNPIDRTYTGTATSSPALVAAIRALSYLPATNLLNLNVTWDHVAGSPVDLGFFATNVTKQKYYTFVPGIVTSLGFEDAALGAPRFFGGSITVHFGS